MTKYIFSVEKFFGHVGKIGIFLVTGGIAGSLFSDKLPIEVGVVAVITGVIFVIIGSFEKLSTKREES